MNTAVMIVYRKDSNEVAVVRITTSDSIDGNEDSILRKLRKEGYDTDQVVWLSDDMLKRIIRPRVIENVILS